MRKIVSLAAIVALVTVPALALAGPSTSSVEENARGYLGIHLQSIRGGLAEALDVEENGGVLVRQVEDGSPAQEAGIEAGDIVTELDGKPVGTPGDLRKAVRSRGPGDEVKVRVLRDGKSKSLSVTLGEASRDDGPRRIARRIHEGLGRGLHKVRELRFHGEHGYLGVTTQPLSGDLGKYFGVEDNEGALVSGVLEDSPAEKLGLRAGDVIIAIGDEEIGDPGELGKVVRSYEEPEEVEVTWVRDKKEKRGSVALEIREAEDGWRHLELDELGRLEWFGRGEDGVRRHVEVRHLDEGMAGELEELREELSELRKELESLRQKVD